MLWRVHRHSNGSATIRTADGTRVAHYSHAEVAEATAEAHNRAEAEAEMAERAEATRRTGS